MDIIALAGQAARWVQGQSGQLLNLRYTQNGSIACCDVEGEGDEATVAGLRTGFGPQNGVTGIAPVQAPASIPTEPPPPAEGTPLAVPVPSEPPPVIVVDDEPSAGDVVIVEPPAPAQEPAGAPAEPEADPWGLAKHDAHKAELRSRSPWRRLQDEAQERLLTREEFVDAAKRMIEQAALEEYDEYVEEWQRRHPPETTV